MKIDLTNMPFGGSYTDTYSKYLGFFKDLQPGDVVINPPLCWIPLINYCKADVQGYQIFFPQDKWLDYVAMGQSLIATRIDGGWRHYIEFISVLRPELVDALWKIDNQWKKDVVTIIEKEFYMTNYNSYFRPEVVAFQKMIHEYSTEHKFAVITNCSADKPYPSKIHQKIKELYPEAELLIATGTFGIVPEALWEDMPEYDCGIPNFWNQKEQATRYFKNNQYDKIHVFTEFYQKSLNEVLFFMCKESEISFEVPYMSYQDYIITDEYFDSKDLTFKFPFNQ